MTTEPTARVNYGITGGGGFVGYRLALALIARSPHAHVHLMDVVPPTQLASAQPTHTPKQSYAIHEDVLRVCMDPLFQAATPKQPCTSTQPHADHAATVLLDDPNSLVSLSDVSLPPPYSSQLHFHTCDLRSYTSVSRACVGMDIVFHIASYGMSGSEMLDHTRIRAVNIDGTDNVIRACRENNVSALVYVSTYNVVFGNIPLIGMDGSTPYFPRHLHVDFYSQTKGIAEQMILAANGTSLASGAHLWTCAIRPAAIWGDGEQRHLPRILRHVKSGMGAIAIGDPSNLCDWVYVDNLVSCLILAGDSLIYDKHSIAAGKAYFCSDGVPMNNFDFLRQIMIGLGYPNCFFIYIPFFLMFYVAWGIEWVHWIVNTCIGIKFQPFLTRAEVLKVGVSHYASIASTTSDLGYRPWQHITPAQALDRTISYYGSRGYANPNINLTHAISGVDIKQHYKIWNNTTIYLLLCCVVIMIYLFLG